MYCNELNPTQLLLDDVMTAVIHALFLSLDIWDQASHGCMASWWGLNLNSLRPRQNGRLFADDTFKRIFLNENIRISTKNSLKYVPKDLIYNIPELVMIMAWRRPGDKPLSEPMLVRSLMHIQNVISFSDGDHFMCAIFLYETGPIEWMFSQHCGYWWPGAIAPGHQ